MEYKLLWGALAVGCAGWLCLLLLASRGGQSLAKSKAPPASNAYRAFEWLALALPFVVWLATLPTKAPFSAGQGWGRGFLLGGLVAFVGASVAQRASNRHGRVEATTSLFGALIVVCIPLLWMRHAIIEALLGAALGWVAVSLIFLCSTAPPDGAAEKNDSPPTALALLHGAAFVTTLCSVAALGVYRDLVVKDVARGTHSAVAVVLAASIGLALLFGSLSNEAEANQNGRSPSPTSNRLFQLATILLCALVPLGIGYFVATKLLDDLNAFYCLGIGSALALLGWGLVWEASQRMEDTQGTSVTVLPVAVLVALCAFMLAYSLAQGFGVGLMLLATWPITVLLLPTSSPASEAPHPNQNRSIRFDVAQTASLLATFLAILLVSRVFATRFRADLRGVSLIDQFALFGFLAGAVVPSLLASLWFGPKEDRTARRLPSVALLRLAGIGVLALVLPGTMLALWGVKVVPTFFAGIALSLAVSGAVPKVRSGAVALFGLALSSLLTQWTLAFLPLAEVSRSQRMQFLVWGVGGAVVLLLVVDFGARLLIHLQNRAGASTPTPGVSP